MTFGEQGDDSPIDPDDPIPPNPIQPLFKRTKEAVTLADFKKLSVIGQGSFGKVYLVQKKNSPEQINQPE